MKKQTVLLMSALLLVCLALLRPVSMSNAQDGTNPQTMSLGPSGFADQYDDMVMTRDGIIYLLNAPDMLIRRYSLDLRQFLDPIPLSYNASPPMALYFSSDSGYLYVRHIYGMFTQIHLGVSLTEEAYPGHLSGQFMAIAGEYLLSMESYSTPFGDQTGFYGWDANGNQVMYGGSLAYNRPSREYVWNAANRRLYYFSALNQPTHLHWLQMDTTGQVVGYFNVPHSSEGTFQPSIRVKTDGSRLIDGTGQMYTGITLEPIGAISGTWQDAVWLGDDLFTLNSPSVTSFDSIVQKWDGQQNQLQGSLTVKGIPEHLFAYADHIVVVSSCFGQLNITILDKNLHMQNTILTFTYLAGVQKPYILYLPPGIYKVNRCGTNDLVISGTFVGTMTHCVTGAHIFEYGDMLLNVQWTIRNIPNNIELTKLPDTDNPYIYLTDNLGNSYKQFQAGDGAAQTVVMQNGVPLDGWFMFMPAKQGANTFVYHNDSLGIVLGPIVITNPQNAQSPSGAGSFRSTPMEITPIVAQPQAAPNAFLIKVKTP